MPRKAKDKNEEKEVKTTKKTVKKETTKTKKEVVKTEKDKKVSKSKTSSGTSKKKVAADKEAITKPKKASTKKTSFAKNTKKETEKATLKQEKEKKVANTSKKKVTADKENITKPKKATAKKTSVAKNTKKETEKAEIKSEKEKKVSNTLKKKVAAIKETIKKATSKKKDDSKNDLTKSKKETSSTKKVTKKTTKTTKATTKSKAKKDEPISVIEYYDLPYRYNQTIVKILAQTPKMLFVYWDISDNDRKAFEEHFGNDFFNKTKPVLIVHNETMNYSFEVEINDFANSWYLHVNDANCKYEIELGRRPFTYLPTIPQNYIYVTSSNKMDAPNNHILFEKFNPSVTYKNTKTGMKSKRDFSSLANYKNMQAIYNIYDLYKKIYKDDLFNEISNNDLLNPSSMSSSFMESSRS